MGSKEESDRRIQRLHEQDREAEIGGKAVVRRFTRLNVDGRPGVMGLGDACDLVADDWERRIRDMHGHVQEHDWGDDPPNPGQCLLIAELLNWALHVEEVRADTQTQLNNYERAALKYQVERGRTDA
jgi:hypothetical protein